MPYERAAIHNIELDEKSEVKFRLLDKLINTFRSVRPDQVPALADKVKKELLIKKIGCSEKVATNWINQALNRIQLNQRS